MNVSPHTEFGSPQAPPRRASARLKDVRKIAVLRANGLGDFIFVLPALEALRSAYQEAEIVLLGRDWHEWLLSRRPGPVDRVIPVPPTRGIREERGRMDDPIELDEFFRVMGEERFDLAIQLHGGGRHSNPFVRRLGARVTAGLKSPHAEPLDRWIPYIYFHAEVLRYLEVVGLVGAPPVTLEPRVVVTAEDLEESERVVVDDRRPIVVVHPGATDARRRWPPERFAAVADALQARGARVLVTGTPPEAAVVDQVGENAQRQIENLCGKLSLRALTGLLSRSALVVSNDTGPLHLARAVGVPTVGIYWCGNFVNGGPTTRTLHRAAISWRVDCPVCGVNCMRGRCDHQSSFAAEVGLDDALIPALSFLDLAAAPREQGIPTGVGGEAPDDYPS